MASPLYRSLSLTETNKIKHSTHLKEETYLGTHKKIEDFTQIELAQAYERIDNHIRNGNTVKNQEIFSITTDFQTAIRFAKPTIVIKNNKVVHIKINRSPIAVFNNNTINNNILNYEDIPKFHRDGKNIGDTAFNYTMGSYELIVTGRLDEFYILTKLYQDLLFCFEEKDEFFKILNTIILPENQKKINEFCKSNLNPIERLIYHIFYVENFNLYEVVAPVYYSNEEANIYCIYDVLFEILLSILTKIFNFIGIKMSETNDLLEKLLDIYNTELNILCLRFENDDYIKLIDFSGLLIEYSELTGDFNTKENYIWRQNLKKPRQYMKEKYDIDNSPLFLYVPKSLWKDQINEFDKYFLSNKNRDFHFLKKPYESIFENTKYERDEEGYLSNSIRIDNYGNIISKKNDKNLSYYIYFNLSIFCSELYIPPYYTSLNPIFFSLDYLKEDCFNFYNWKENTHELTKKDYNRERKKYFFKNHKLLYSYTDRLIKIFGGKNLNNNNDYNYYLDERLKKRSCKDKIINLLNHNNI